MLTNQYQRRDPSKKLVLKPNFSEKVALVKFYPGLDPAIIDYYVEKGIKGHFAGRLRLGAREQILL